MIDITAVRTMLQDADIVVINDVGYRINSFEDDHFQAVDEETGDEVSIDYDEVDLTTALVYKLVLMNP